MHLIQPSLLIANDNVPNGVVETYAQVLCEDFRRWLDVLVPRVVLSENASFNPCQSPSKEWACVINGELFIASRQWNTLQLQFIIAHALTHQVVNIAEWECDLITLDWMNYFDVPMIESTVSVIAQTPYWRTQALQFVSGQRAVAIGDALINQIWNSPVLQMSLLASHSS